MKRTLIISAAVLISLVVLVRFALTKVDAIGSSKNGDLLMTIAAKYIVVLKVLPFHDHQEELLKLPELVNRMYKAAIAQYLEDAISQGLVTEDEMMQLRLGLFDVRSLPRA